MPVGGQQNTDDTAEHDDRNEVRHVEDQLNLLLGFFAENAVEQEREQDRDREAPEQAKDTELQGVHQVAHEVRRREEALEVVKADPLAVEQTPDGVVLCERHGNSAHGDVAEDHRQQEGRRHKNDVQLPVLLQVYQGVMRFCASLSAQRACRWGNIFHRIPPFLFSVCIRPGYANTPCIFMLDTIRALTT